MKAAVYAKAGSPEVFEYRDVPDPAPGDHDIVIRVAAISIEGGDLVTRRLVDPPSPTHVPGYAAAGEVVALGAAVTGFRVGQKVASFGFGGSHAELRAVPAATSWVIPDDMDPAQAAASVVGVGTALDALQLGELKADDRVLITGAAGVVGVAAIQIARQAGARVLGTSSSAASLEALKDYGLTDPILLDGRAPLAEKVQAVLGEDGATLLIDNVGGNALTEALDALRKGGRAVLVGAAEGGQKNLDSSTVLLRRLRLTGCFLGPIMGQSPQREMVADAIAMVASGKVRIPVDHVFPLSQAAAAHSRAEERGKLGRVIMVPDSIGG